VALLALPRLAWLAYAGNPFCAAQEAAALRAAPGPRMAWDALQLQHVLGQGASGVIHQAHWQHATGAQPVALKLFKGAVTSDGLPQSEMAACLQAGAHPHLIPLLGQLADHPDGAPGLLMVDGARLSHLAGPPSLDTRTRDVMLPTPGSMPPARPPGARHGLGGAPPARKAHDCTGHNILHNGQGLALLGDLAPPRFWLPTTQHARCNGWKCAWAVCWKSYCCPPGTDTLAPLAALARACQHEDVSARPLFDEIEQRLRTLAGGLQFAID
jgi:hypothetical protein